MRSALLICVAIFLLGCSGATTRSDNAIPRASNVPGMIPANNAKAPENSAEQLPSLAQAQANRLRGKQLADQAQRQTGPAPQPQFFPAPEDSEIATTMNPDGSFVETRVFKHHPQIEKAELTWLNPKEKVLKIYYHGGRVTEARADGIANLRQASSEQLLAAAGGNSGQSKPVREPAAKGAH